MRNPRNWTLRTLIVTIISSIVGFWLLDGISLVVSIFGKGFQVETSGRVASTIVCVAFALVVEQAYMTHWELVEQRNEMTRILESDIMSQFADGIRQMLTTARILTAATGGDTESMRLTVIDLSSLIQPVVGLPEPLRSGAARWMRGPIESHRQSLNALMANGVSASLSEHVAVTKAMFDAGTGDYLQINLRSYDAATEWTREWRAFLDHTKLSRGRRVEYVVFSTAEYLRMNDANLRSMRDYLAKCRAVLLTCDQELVNDSVGKFNLQYNLEVFDSRVLKTQTASASGYRGGISLDMSISQVDERPELFRLANIIRESAVPYR
jgi:hypothetical protein